MLPDEALAVGVVFTGLADGHLRYSFYINKDRAEASDA